MFIDTGISSDVGAITMPPTYVKLSPSNACKRLFIIYVFYMLSVKNIRYLKYKVLHVVLCRFTNSATAFPEKNYFFSFLFIVPMFL